jgi:hypothetical protein
MPPSHPEASSADTSEVGNKNTIAGSRHKNTQARPYTAIVGAARKLATELVVTIANATHEIHWALAARVRADGTTSSAGTPAVLMTILGALLVYP